MIDKGDDSDRAIKGFLDAFMAVENPGASDIYRVQWVYKRHTHMRKLPSDVAGALAAAMVRSGDAELGITLLQDVLTDDPSNQDLRLKLADSLVMAGRASEAHPHYRALLSDEQNKPGGGK